MLSFQKKVFTIMDNNLTINKNNYHSVVRYSKSTDTAAEAIGAEATAANEVLRGGIILKILVGMYHNIPQMFPREGSVFPKKTELLNEIGLSN